MINETESLCKYKLRINNNYNYKIILVYWNLAMVKHDVFALDSF